MNPISVAVITEIGMVLVVIVSLIEVVRKMDAEH